MNPAVRLVPWLVIGLLAGCASEPERPVTRPSPVQDPEQDGYSGTELKPSDIPDAVPRPEALARYGNRSPYVVLGKTYTVLPSAEGYRERGIASWYGRKFHGRRTSSGELYDMHKATAAHKSLPLPTYAEVTNLDNGRKVIVKINDRGPFHDQRLIDLSYGAAVRLGMEHAGTARVEVRAITFGNAQPVMASARLDDDTYLQAGAFGNRGAARSMAEVLEKNRIAKVDVKRGDGLYRVFVGPFKYEADLQAAANRIVELGYERPHKVKR